MDKKENQNKLVMISNLKTPDEALEKIFLWLSKEKKEAFLVSLFIGIITHIIAITSLIMSQDGLWNSIQYFKPGIWELSIGRWGLVLFQLFNFYLALPSISIITSLIAISCMVVLIVDLFDIKSRIYIFLIAIIYVTSPSLTSLLMYPFTSFAYCFNYLICVFAFWIFVKDKNRVRKVSIISILIMFSISIYQSVISVYFALFFMTSFINISIHKKDMKELISDFVDFLSTLLIGGILYYVVTKIVLDFNNLSKISYKGFDNVFSILFKDFFINVLQTYKDFGTYLFGDKYIYNSNFRREIFTILSFIISIIYIIFAINKIEGNSKKERIIKTIIGAFIVLCIPISLCFLDLILEEEIWYALSTYQIVLVFPFSLSLLEKIDKGIILKWLMVICYLYIGFTYYLSDNASYIALKLSYNQTYSYASRILGRIENLDEYYVGKKILIAGIIEDKYYKKQSDIYTYVSSPQFRNPVLHGTYEGAQGTWDRFYKIFLGRQLYFCSRDEYEKIISSDEFYKMDIFPNKESVKIIDDIIVVKLNFEPAK